jgi:hypothetical protein
MCNRKLPNSNTRRNWWGRDALACVTCGEAFAQPGDAHFHWLHDSHCTTVTAFDARHRNPRCSGGPLRGWSSWDFEGLFLGPWGLIQAGVFAALAHTGGAPRDEIEALLRAVVAAPPVPTLGVRHARVFDGIVLRTRAGAGAAP